MSEPYACYMIDHWCICRWYGNKCPLYALCHNEHDYETSVEEKCSLCGRYVYRYDTELQDNDCPNCGAKMESEGST